MPHFIIEYSSDLEDKFDPGTLINAVYLGAISTGLFLENDIKIRTLRYKHYLVGKTDTGFVHVTSKILAGRNLKQRQSLSESILLELSQVCDCAVSLTVEINEIEKLSYSKLIK